jgi:DNA-directed RNA polymerase specialized sigma subunit
MFTSTRASKQAFSTDPAVVWQRTRILLYCVAIKVKLAIRLKLEGHGRAEAELEELVNDAFITLLEALPRFDPATAKLTTFAYGLARRRMWLVARACFYGLSPEQMHRMDTAKRTPHFHRGEQCLRLTKAAAADEEQRQSVRKVEAIRQQLPRRDRRLIDIYLEEGGNMSAVGRRLSRRPNGDARCRYVRLFQRIRDEA